MQRFLEGAGRGLVVDVASSGRAAMDLVTTAGVEAYDVVWCDVNLGSGLSGIEVRPPFNRVCPSQSATAADSFDSSAGIQGDCCGGHGGCE